MEDVEEGTLGKNTGVIAAAILLPIASIVYHFRGADTAVSTFLFIGTVVFAALLKWKLRTNIWFWLVLFTIALLHIPLIVSIHWPPHWVHGIVLLPICLLDLTIIVGIISLAERLLLKETTSSPK